MATTSKPKDLRSLMKEQLSKSKKKVDSPLAKYNNAGQLFCVLCNTILKSDLLWDAHIRGTKHKENLNALKSGQSKSQPNATKLRSIQQDKPIVIKTTQGTSQSLNKRRNDNTNNSLSSDAPALKKSKASSPSSNSSIPNDFFDTSIDDQHNMVTDNSAASTSTSLPSEKTALPTDFFDAPNTETEGLEELQPQTEELDKSIPEGFFDDPKLDAKARKVEYKDPGDEEWEKFQKALSTENQVSEAIIYEEEEESRVDRALDEISQQRQYFLRADNLRDKQIAFKKIQDEKKDQNNASNMSEDSNSDSDDLEEMFNWRAKKALS